MGYDMVMRDKTEKTKTKGVYHWMVQRITAVLLLPIGMWFVTGFTVYLTSPFNEAKHWVSSPMSGTLLTLFTITAIYHGYLGLQVVIEDYIPNLKTRTLWLFFIRVISFFLAVLSVISLVQIMKS